MDGVRKSSYTDIAFQGREGAPDLNCCSVNAPRGIANPAEWAFTERYWMEYCVNWYGPVSASLLGGRWQIDIESDYPFDPRVRLRIQCIDARRDILYFRIPAWSERTRFVIDGEEREVTAGSYHKEKRDWSRGVTIDIEFDFSLWQWTGEKEKEGLVSLYRGPVLLAYDDRFNTVRAEEAAAVTITPGEPERLPEGGLAFASDKGPVILTDFARAGSAGTKYATWLRTARPVRDIASKLRGV